MATTKCDNCGGDYHWCWAEAFDKFGFNDGESQVEPESVADALRDAGYSVVTEPWGLHNITIMSITRDGVELIPDDITYGYDDPAGYLPKAVVELLDKQFAD